VGLDKNSLHTTIYDVFAGDVPASEAIQRSVLFSHLDVLPATPDLAGAEVEMVSREQREKIIRHALQPLQDQYDYILIDCPPSLGLITVNMLAAADCLLIPVQCEYYALEGLSQLLNTVHLVQRGV